jgi:voltage-gated potassium channel
MTLRKRIYRLFDDNRDWFDYTILGIIFVNLTFMILESVSSLHVKYHKVFDTAEAIAAILFSIEYTLRVWTIVEKSGFNHPIKGRLKFIFSFMGLVDLFSFMFFYLKFVGLTISSLQAFQSLRIIKILRFFKSLNIIVDIIRERWKMLVSSMMIVGFVLIMASVGIYHLEHAAQPDKFSSIPNSMYWGVITMTSVGYGDISPITPMGKVFGALVAVLGIVSFAIPVGIVASGFIDYFNNQNRVPEEKNMD